MEQGPSDFILYESSGRGGRTLCTNTRLLCTFEITGMYEFELYRSSEMSLFLD